MLRRSSPVARVLTYATFFAISLAIHMVVILGEERDELGVGPPSPTPTQTAGGRR